MPCYFIKILMGEWRTKLRIPRLIVRSCKLNPKSVILTNASSKSLRMVNMEKEEEDPSELYFKKGWTKFAQENALEAADILFFEFDGKSRFEVIIFGRSACEKKLERLMSRAHMHGNSHRKQHSKPTATTQDCGENSKGKNPMYVEIKEERENFDDPGTSNQEMRDETWPLLFHEEEVKEEEEEEEEEESVDIGEGRSLAIIPSFTVQLQPSSADGVMCIPTDFFKRYMRKKKHEVEMETVNGVWKVTLLPHVKRNRMFARFSRGWSDFARRNGFQFRETLHFKMIRRGKCPKFMVHKQ